MTTHKSANSKIFADIFVTAEQHSPDARANDVDFKLAPDHP